MVGLTASFVVLNALALTVSRGAWLLGIPAGVALCLLWWQTAAQGKIILGRQTTRMVGIAAIAILTVAFLLLGSRLSNSATVASRWSIWRDSWQLWLDHWLAGVGPGGFFWRYPAYLTQFTNEPNILHPHNVWLEVAATWGVLGWLWLFVLLAIVVRTARRIYTSESGEERWLAAGAVAGLLAAFAHAQVDTFLLLPDLAGWNWLALGLLAGIQKGPDSVRTLEIQRQT
jgi:O-antigen ligase